MDSRKNRSFFGLFQKKKDNSVKKKIPFVNIGKWLAVKKKAPQSKAILAHIAATIVSAMKSASTGLLL
jgi:hypothetical protein